MKGAFLLVSSLLASSVFASPAEKWYTFCLAEAANTRYCTTPTEKTGASKEKCVYFAETKQAQKWIMYSSTELADLETTLHEQCDEIVPGPMVDMYSCGLAVLCPKSNTPKVSNFSKKVVADTHKTALDRCMIRNEDKIKEQLKLQSANGCFMKLVTAKATH